MAEHPFLIHTDPAFETKMNTYPDHIQPKMAFLRQLVVETAAESKLVPTIEETLKWGEPSFVTKYGSTLRMDWKEKAPDQYAIYFKCTSKLVPTFREVFEGVFHFEGNREMVFLLTDKIPVPELKACITAALTYHKVKGKAHLGIQGK